MGVSSGNLDSRLGHRSFITISSALAAWGLMAAMAGAAERIAPVATAMPARPAAPASLTQLGQTAWSRQQELAAQRETFVRSRGARTAAQRRVLFRQWDEAHRAEIAELFRMHQAAAAEKARLTAETGETGGAVRP